MLGSRCASKIFQILFFVFLFYWFNERNENVNERKMKFHGPAWSVRSLSEKNYLRNSLSAIKTADIKGEIS